MPKPIQAYTTRPKDASGLLSLDTETTGIDLHHSSRPFFVTTCDLDGNQQFWEVDVDPLTREPQWTEEDLDEIAEAIDEAGQLVLQNAKFDVRALWTVRREFGDNWAWDKTQDTLMAGHLLASNQPHDLTTMALVYCGINIQPYEIALKGAVNEARRIARSIYPEWCIARPGDADMPSIKGGGSACDYWLPRAIAQARDYDTDHPWWTLLRDYSNADSAVTVKLFSIMRKRLEEENLWEIYQERMKSLPVAFQMEQTGITVSGKRMEKQIVEYGRESLAAGKVCVSIAKKRGIDLELPKSGNNKSLLSFCFSQEELGECPSCKDVPRKGPKTICKVCGGSQRGGAKGLQLPTVMETSTGNPSLNKVALEEYISVYAETSDEHQFLSNLRDKRKRDTAISYMESYQRFWLPLGIFNKKGEQLWYRLHPSLNPTGTDTLRWSSSSPNEQNISKTEGFNLRYSFGPAPGREWWSLDYENIELRIPAYESGQEAMIDLFERPDDPPYFGSYHLLNASIIYPDIFWPIAEKKGLFKDKYKASWYQWCKNAGFALIYGCQEAKFDSTSHREGSYNLLKDKLPKLFQLSQKMQDQANKLGYVETIPDKTVNPARGYPIYCSRSKWGKVSPTIPLNYHVQSTAMWCTMKGMIRCAEYLKQFPGHFVVMQVHDEMVFDFPKGGKKNLPKVRKLRQLMEQSGKDIGIPLKVAISYHPENWSKETTV